MADISFYSDTKKNPNYNSILKKISEKYKNDFNYDESFLNNKDQLLGKLYEFRGKFKSVSDTINIDIFVSKDFILNRETNYSREIKYSEYNTLLNTINGEKKMFEYVSKIYRNHKIISNEIYSYIYIRNSSLTRHIDIKYENNIINDIISFMDNSNILPDIIQDIKYGGIELLDKEYIDLLIKEIEGIKKIINNKYNLLDFDINLKADIKVDKILKFLITKIEELNIQVDTTKIEDLFEDLSNKAFLEAKSSLCISLKILFCITLGNVLLAIFNTEFDIKSITRYIPMILLEIILFKFMFFFFDKYNTYSKISSIYDYYKGLVQADNIYTIDKKFTAEQNFTLREKTYLELTNLTNHLKGLVDKNQNNSKEIIDILKEVNNISPIFKNLNK